ncbi:Thiosulfate sulfurtransferase GlpE [uncultured archaeon]|nr:Thiosulfate sulfurtransferase GlpE [uncultured archaeon]
MRISKLMRKICPIAGIVILLVALSGCTNPARQPEEAKQIDITVEHGKKMIDGGEVFILDVRTVEEYDAGHINGSVLIPLQDLEKRLNEIPRDRKILVYCRTGHRSTQASEILVKNGFTQVYNMNGGITEWTKAGYEVIK